MVDVIFHDKARAELRTAVQWYENHQTGLGRKFLTELDKAVHEITNAPYLWPITFGARTRRHSLNSFPYAILYEGHEHIIWIIAIAHAKRRPGYWKSRLNFAIRKG